MPSGDVCAGQQVTRVSAGAGLCRPMPDSSVPSRPHDLETQPAGRCPRSRPAASAAVWVAKGCRVEHGQAGSRRGGPLPECGRQGRWRTTASVPERRWAGGSARAQVIGLASRAPSSQGERKATCRTESRRRRRVADPLAPEPCADHPDGMDDARGARNGRWWSDTQVDLLRRCRTATGRPLPSC